MTSSKNSSEKIKNTLKHERKKVINFNTRSQISILFYLN